MANTLIPNVYAIFHLNLAFSSIDNSEHQRVVDLCYWPLLHLIEGNSIPLGIELTAYTLECIQAVDPSWIAKFKSLLKDNHCELIASGDSQIIGPLIPSKVNMQNLLLGQKSYQALLGYLPKIAYINEQAVSAGLLDCYIDCGFDAVVVEWDNPFSHNADWAKSSRYQPQQLIAASGRTIKVIWNHAVAFQKFQRYAHDEMTSIEYFEFLARATNDASAFSLYGSDAEVFNYRPGRFSTETKLDIDEWQRIELLFTAIKEQEHYRWVSPSELLSPSAQYTRLKVQTPAHPISVKKQAKYNVTRWALSGRNDLSLNSLCYRKYLALKDTPLVSEQQWRELCRLWASDLRTHLTSIRYQELLNYYPVVSNPTVIAGPKANLDSANTAKSDYQVHHCSERNTLTVEHPQLKLVLSGKRGMAIKSLAFARHNFEPIIGTLPHGFFDHISYAADFYSNHLVMERYSERDRVTDLSQCHFNINHSDTNLLISTEIMTPQGKLTKWYRLEGEQIECGFDFENQHRPEATIRLGYLTLLNSKQRNWFACHNGGNLLEIYHAEQDFNHGSPVSSIVSANSALGATEGVFYTGVDNLGLKISWSPEFCAALPMLSSQAIDDSYLNRAWLSLSEADETLKADGQLLNFSYQITPCFKTDIS
ncbi:glycoside hydrolase family 57 [Shewanella halifaxensis HAW-EB4]|uniref:Glycoside hydrolase family 57 n=1 Tax=Shewanella halifaxensis (strain HAW-EB4) TaxID=458817 RepID=B0TLL2_SHEHH|nr:glycoside hydrolase [Shewanella halifaxensis]ABZ75962.1 glycoside hydrolase family 57 [Shewanella halifaxensis HAW-EB4]